MQFLLHVCQQTPITRHCKLCYGEKGCAVVCYLLLWQTIWFETTCSIRCDHRKQQNFRLGAGPVAVTSHYTQAGFCPGLLEFEQIMPISIISEYFEFCCVVDCHPALAEPCTRCLNHLRLRSYTRSNLHSVLHTPVLQPIGSKSQFVGLASVSWVEVWLLEETFELEKWPGSKRTFVSLNTGNRVMERTGDVLCYMDVML
jgi:hypothetical protein